MDKTIGKHILNSIRRNGFFAIYLLAIGKYTQFFKPELSKDKAIHIMDEDWDHLIILDACRYDLFKEIVDNDAPYVISGGSVTREWILWNFNNKYNDVVCIAGNPHLASASLQKTLGFVPFHEVYEVWDFGWDETLKTVPPRAVTHSALEALEEHPDKRLYIHYNQPHHPFIGDKELLAIDEGASRVVVEGQLQDSIPTSVWELLKRGQVSTASVWKGYKQNLEIVMEEVEKLVKKLNGKVIVTSDHGNSVGEHGIYGHPLGIRFEELVKVPWYEVQDGKPPSTKKTGSRKDSNDFEMDRIHKSIRMLKTDKKL